MIPMTPLLVSAVAGAGDGILVKNDADNARTQISKQYGTWYEAALLAGGLLISMGGVGYQMSQFAEPITGAGAALLGSRLTQWAMKQQATAAIATPAFAGASIPRAAFYPSHAAGAVNKQPTMTLI